MRFIKLAAICLISISAISVSAQKKKTVKKKTTTVKTSTASNTSISDSEISGGLKEALAKGVKTAVNLLGRDNGFLDNTRVKIPVPQNLQKVEKGLRFAGQGKMVDEFVASMNHAAEKAVPVAIDVFIEAIKKMTFSDAKDILLSGRDDSATQFFRRTTEENLRGKFRPIVEKFTAQTGVTSNYKRMIGKAGFASQLFGNDATDLDGYVTQKALDGLFLLVADEERNIRKDPIGQASSVLRKVFGSVLKH